LASAVTAEVSAETVGLRLKLGLVVESAVLPGEVEAVTPEEEEER